MRTHGQSNGEPITLTHGHFVNDSLSTVFTLSVLSLENNKTPRQASHIHKGLKPINICGLIPV